MNWGIIISDAIVFFISVVFVFLWNEYIKPYIEQHHLTEIASIVVHAAEAAYGAGHGAQKLQYCIDQINKTYNITMDSQKIVQAVESAWHTMNTQQIAAGEKLVSSIDG